MYQVKCDGNILLDHRDPSLILENPEVTVEVNTIGSGSFTIYNTHPYFNKLKKMKSVFEVRDEIGVVFRGRMPKEALDFDNVREVELEGVLGYFNDSIVRPYNFPDDFLDDADYISASESGNVVKFFLKWFIDNHNSQVQPFQQFKLGEVTVSDPNNYIIRSSGKHTKTWAELKSKLFESGLGGYLCIRYEDDGNYIDYLSEFELTNTQDIVFGENLLDVNQESDATPMFTAIIPIGAEIETESTDEESGETITVKTIINIEGLTDGNITDDIIKEGDTIYSKSGVENYGWIYADVENTTWEDVTSPDNLLTKATNVLIQEGLMFNNVVEYNACDLHFTDAQIRSFRVYRNVRVDSAPHNQKGLFPLTKLQIPLLKPQNTKITVGVTTLSLSDLTFDTAIKIEKAEKDIEETRQNVTSVKNQIYAESTSIMNSCNEIILSALSSYTETGDFDEFKETVESQLQLLSDQMNLKFTETIQEIENVNGDLQEKYNTITTHFQFEVDGLEIGQTDSPYKIVISHNKQTTYANDVEVQVIDAVSGEVLTPKLKVTDTFNLLGFQLDKDEENEIVNCEYVGGGM